MAQDFIAILDGLGDFRNPSGSNGANYSGGGAYYAGAPIMYADRGLAGAGAALAAAAMPTGVFPESGSWAEAFVPEDTNVVDADQDFNSYLAAMNGSRRAEVVKADFRSPSGSNGANYSGGGAYYAGAPIMYADRGLAGDGGYGDRSFRGFAGNGYRSSLAGNGWGHSHQDASGAGYHMAAVETSNVPNGWASGQYSGGASYYGGAPTYPSGSGGLARLRALAAVMGLSGLGGDGSTSVAIAQQVLATGRFSGTPCDQAYQAAFQAAIRAGYDNYWANDAGKRVQARCLALGYADFSTRA